MKQQVIKELSSTELHERLEEEKKQYQKLIMNHAVSPLENPMKIKDYQKTVARMLTEIQFRKVMGKPVLVDKTNKKSNKK